MQEQQQTISQPQPELLYHYTDQKGLSGIVESECLWATHHRFLNDISERLEAIRYFSNIISRRKSNKFMTGLGGQINEFVQNEVQRNLEKEFQSVDVYLVCFTQEDVNPELASDSQMLGDRLSQWRGYAQGRQGFSLAFQRDRLMSDAAQLPKTKILVGLLKCIYNDLEKEAVAGTYLTYSETEILSWGRNGPENDINQLKQLKRLFHQFCSGFKHIGFKEETEWRLALHMLVEYPDIQLRQLSPHVKYRVKWWYAAARAVSPN